MSLADRRWLRLATLCLLYVAQGIPWGFTATTLPNYLTERGLDEQLVNATMAFTVIPYSFKWVYGPLIDAVTIPRLGRRRPWILLAQVMMASTILAMVALDVAADLKLLAWLVLLHTVFNALQDVAVDALAIDLLDEDERGRANGLMYGSKYLGGFLGGAGVATLIAKFGLDTALLVQVAVLVAILAVPLLVKETAAPPADSRTRDVGRAFAEAFSLRSTIVAALFALLCHVPTGVLTNVSRVLYVQDLGWDFEEVTALTGGWGLIAGGIAAAGGGFLADRFGARRVLVAGYAALAAGWALFGLAPSLWTARGVILALALYEPICQALAIAASLSLYMQLAHPRIAGSHFAAYMALSNFSTVLGYQLAAPLRASLSYEAIYLASAGVQIAALGLVALIDPAETRRTLPRPPGARIDPRGLIALAVILVGLVGLTAYAILPRLT